jgi:hypothetical protein
MIYSIGTPGQPPRLFITTDIPANAQLQCQDGETCVAVESPPPVAVVDPNRAIRDAILIQLSNADLPANQQPEYDLYRQALNAIDFSNLVWPVPPQTFPRDRP